MKSENLLLSIKNRREFRQWLTDHSTTKKECWIASKRGKPTDNINLWYLDAVEEALCFGWIDSIHKQINGVFMQRFSPRRAGSHWTELNKERCRRLERLGLMTDAGRAVLPNMDIASFVVDDDIVTALKNANAWKTFKSFPSLYQQIRASNVAFYKKRNASLYTKALQHLINETKKGRLFGNWNDYCRLSIDV